MMKAVEKMVRRVHRQCIVKDGEVYVPISEIPILMGYAQEKAKDAIVDAGLSLYTPEARTMFDAQNILKLVLESDLSTIEKVILKESNG